MRAGRFFAHISQTCCRCDQYEDAFHLFFLCPFVRASWYSSPWFLRTDTLVQGHDTIHSLLNFLFSMNHPYASVQNVFTFLWCIWKARNDCLFQRKSRFPHQVHQMEQAISHCSSWEQQQNISQPVAHTNFVNTNTGLPQQGGTLSSDLLFAGPRIFSDASWKCDSIPGRMHMQAAAGS